MILFQWTKLRITSLLLTVTILLSGGWLWWSFVSPYGYQHPAPWELSYSDEPQRVFVYGTLRNPVLRRAIIRRAVDARPAILPDYRKENLDIVPAAGDQTPGLVFTVDAEGLRRLDRYERLGLRYQRVELLLADDRSAWVYRRLKE